MIKYAQLMRCLLAQYVLKGISRAAAALLSALLLMSPAYAGPPFTTDNVDPTEYGHFMSYLFSSGTRTGSETEGTAVGLEVDYGVLPQTEISVVIPLEFHPSASGTMGYGLHSLQFGAKYRFLQETEGGVPQIAFAPRMELPLNAQSDTKAARYLLPIWLQKSLGGWTAYTGGGYNINPGPDCSDYWSFGTAVVRQILSGFSLGAEVFGQTADDDEAQASLSAGVGALYDFNEAWHVVGSVSTGIVNRRGANEFSYYVGFGWSL